MKIAVDIREWQPGIRTGIGRFLEEFLVAAAILRPENRFLLIGDESCEVRAQPEHALVLRIPEWCTVWWDQVTIARTVARSGADVLYSPYIKVPLAASVPVVSTIHDLTFFLRRDYNRTWTDVLLNLPFQLFCHGVVRRAAAIITDSATSAADVRRLLGAEPEKLRIVPLATSPAFRPEGDPDADAAVRRRYDLLPGYVLYLGSFWPHKNVPLVARAHAALPCLLRSRHPLVLAGSSLSRELQLFLARPEIALGARYIGPIPDNDLPAVYRGACLFVFPSRYEGFGLPVLEAMASGVPVLCSSAPALVEVACGAAEHVAPEDGPGWTRSLQVLLEDPGRRAVLAERGRARAALFTPERMATEILSVLDEVVGCRQ